LYVPPIDVAQTRGLEISWKSKSRAGPGFVVTPLQKPTVVLKNQSVKLDGLGREGAR